MEKDQLKIEGRNAVLEAIRAGKSIDRLYVQTGLRDRTAETVIREAKKAGIRIRFAEKAEIEKEAPDENHQGFVAVLAAYRYAEISEMLELAKERNEDAFLILLDGIEDPHNLGAIIRTANQAGAHGVIIRENRAVGLTATVARTSAGALNYTKVAKVTNMARTIEDLKKEGLWFVSADMDGTVMYDLDMRGPVGLVIGNEGVGISRLVREHCDMTASIPMKGNVDSLNASVAAGILSFEIVRQRYFKN